MNQIIQRTVTSLFIFLLLTMACAAVLPTRVALAQEATLADQCDLPAGGSFLGFPHWYQYLSGIYDQPAEGATRTCIPQIKGINDVWLIVAAIIEILIRVAALVAIGFIVFAGFKFITSRGEPDKTREARDTIWDAIIGLVIAIIAATAVSFIAGKFNS